MSRHSDSFHCANQAAVALRDNLEIDDIDPVNPWDIAEALNVKVRFVDTNMEGMYFSGTPSRIIQTSLRPMGRRAFTCAHELGHHEFGHGTRLDVAISALSDSTDINERLADSFAASLLMPTIGIRRAFSERKWDIHSPTPQEVFTVACEFGVGYQTLLLYLESVMHVLPRGKKEALAKVTPKSIRRDLLGEVDAHAMVLIDGSSRCKTLELDIGTVLLSPESLSITGDSFIEIPPASSMRMYQAVKRGTALVKGNNNMEARVWPKGYVGLAKFRALEE